MTPVEDMSADDAIAGATSSVPDDSVIRLVKKRWAALAAPRSARSNAQAWLATLRILARWAGDLIRHARLQALAELEARGAPGRAAGDEQP